MAKRCTTKQGQKAKAAIRAVTDLSDLSALITYAKEHRAKLAGAVRAERQQTSWAALQDGETYRLKAGWVHHGILMPGLHYTLQRYNGRKYKGAWANRANEKPIFLPLDRCDDVELVPEGEAEDQKAVEHAAQFRRHVRRVFNGNDHQE